MEMLKSQNKACKIELSLTFFAQANFLKDVKKIGSIDVVEKKVNEMFISECFVEFSYKISTLYFLKDFFFLDDKPFHSIFHDFLPFDAFYGIKLFVDIFNQINLPELTLPNLVKDGEVPQR